MTPTIITDAADMARILAERRIELGMTVEELDAHAGFQERYSGKLEHPGQHWGRGSLHMTPMATIWLDSLGLKLVLMPKEQAEGIGAVEPTPKPRIAAPAKKQVGQPVRYRRTYRLTHATGA